MINKDLTYNEIAKIANENGCVLLSCIEWESFTKKLWQVAEENKRLKKINDRLRTRRI